MNPDQNIYSLIILAGGNSQRMGEDKGLKTLNGKRFIDHILQAAAENVVDKLIISDHLEHYKLYDFVYPDIIKNQGPLGGIYSGLHYSKTDLNFVVSCDTPLINAKVFEKLSTEQDEKFDIVHFDQHPLIGIYKKDICNAILKLIHKKSLSVRYALSTLKTKILNTHNLEKHLTNINTPQQFQNVQKAN